MHDACMASLPGTCVCVMLPTGED